MICSYKLSFEDQPVWIIIHRFIHKCYGQATPTYPHGTYVKYLKWKVNPHSWSELYNLFGETIPFWHTRELSKHKLKGKEILAHKANHIFQGEMNFTKKYKQWVLSMNLRNIILKENGEKRDETNDTS